MTPNLLAYTNLLANNVGFVVELYRQGPPARCAQTTKPVVWWTVALDVTDWTKIWIVLKGTCIRGVSFLWDLVLVCECTHLEVAGQNAREIL